MRSTYIALAATLVIQLLLLAPSATAAENIDCVRTALGQTVVWNSGWQNDHQDHGVHYRIAKLGNTLQSSEGVRVELQALGSANRGTRLLHISTPSIAKLLCSGIIRKKLSFPDAVSAGGVQAKLPTVVNSTSGTRRPAAKNPEELPYIYFSDSGWVRGNAPSSEELTVCLVSHMRFACTESDKSRHAAHLKSVEEELRARR